jgi:hypothetical protein
MNQTILKQFHAALTHLLKEEGRGAQTRLASEQKIDRGYLNAIVKQRKSGSSKVWEKVAHHFKMTFEEMLSFGRNILAEAEAPVLDQIKREETGFSEDFPIDPADKIKKYDISPKSEKTTPDIPEKIIKTIEILGGGSGYNNLLSDVIDVFHKMINTEKENVMLKNKLKELESRLTLLEYQSEREMKNSVSRKSHKAISPQT